MPWGKNGWGGAWGGAIVPDVPEPTADPAYHYVNDATGDDEAAGTYAAPWKTLAAVMAHTLNPGDTVWLNKGDTFRPSGGLVVGQSGTAGNPITFAAYGTGARPIIARGTLLTSATYKWTASGSGTNEYHLELAAGGNPSLSEPRTLVLDGTNCGVKGKLGSLADHKWGWGDNDTLGYNTVYFRDDTADPDASGVVLEMVAATSMRGIDLRTRSYITVQDIHVRSASYGIDASSCSNILLSGCEFTECGYNTSLGGTGTMQITGCTFNHNFENAAGAYGGNVALIACSNVEIDHNTVIDNQCALFEVYPRSTMTNLSVHHNNIYATTTLTDTGVFEIAGPPPGNVAISNVSIYYNRMFNVRKFITCHNKPHETSGEGCVPTNFSAYNNTFADTVDRGNPTDAYIKFTDNVAAGVFTYKNNIAYLGEYWHFFENAVNLDNVVHSNNCYYHVFASTNLTPAVGVTEMEEDPKFTNVGTGDLTLAADSPCLNTGATTAYTLDLAGAAVGDPPEIGCYEYTA
jgi:hypothetical protein